MRSTACRKRQKERQYHDSVDQRKKDPASSDDRERYRKYRQMAEKHCKGKFHLSEAFTAEGHKHWAETMVNTWQGPCQFIICTQEEKPVGSVYLRDIDRTHNKAEYGIFIGEEEALSKGYGQRQRS